MAETKKYLHTLDVSNNKVTNLLLNPLTTIQRTTIGGALGIGDQGYVCYDTELNQQYFWDGTQWIVVGGGSIGPGTTNYLPKWDITGTDLVDSQVFDDGTYVRIGIGGGSMSFPYEKLILEAPQDMKFGAYTSVGSFAFGGASYVLGYTNITTALGYYPGFEFQMSGDALDADNFIRYNFLQRDAAGIVINSNQNIFNLYADSRISFKTLIGAGTEMVVADDFGFISRQPIPTGNITGTGVATRVAFWDTTTSLSSDADLYWDNVNKRLGIGTATPTENLDINGNIIGRGTYGMYLVGNNTGVWFNSSRTIGIGLDTNDIYFRTNNIGNRLVIKNDGKIGIGTLTPAYLLDVNGNQNISGRLNFNNPYAVNQIRIGSGDANVGGASTQPYLTAIGTSAAFNLTSNGGNSLTALGVQAGFSITTGGSYSVHIGRNSGRGITTGSFNTHIGGSDITTIPSDTTGTIHLVGYSYEFNNPSNFLFNGLTNRYAFIGGGYSSAYYINDFYLGAGPFVSEPQYANLNLYAPSGTTINVGGTWSSVNSPGSNFTINAGRGTGEGTPGDFIIKTATKTTTGNTLQTLAERVKVAGNNGEVTINNLATGGADKMVTADTNGKLKIQTIPSGGGGTVTSVGAGTGMSFTAITTSGNVAIDTAKVPYYASAPSNGLLKYTSGTWSTDTSTYLTSAITSLGGLTGATQTFGNDTNVTMVSSGTTHTLTWSGTLADARIASASTWNGKQNALSGTGIVKSTAGTISYLTDNTANWDTAYTNRITSLTTTGTGAATLVANVLNIPTPPTATFTSLTVTGSSGASTLLSGVLNVPTYTLSGLGGQPLATNLTSLSGLTYASTSFVKMTAAGTFSLDTNTYLTSAVTSVGATSPITSSGGNTPTISTSMATNKLIGRSSAGTGVMEEITLGTGLSFSGTTLNASGTSPLTTKGDIYTFNSTNTRLPVGLDTQILLADSSTATGLKWGTNTAATPTGYYGAWQDNVTQTAAVSNTGYAMIFRTIDIANGVSVVTNGTNLTRITFANSGVYNLQFSSQFQNLANSPQDVTIWLRKYGTDVPGSAGVVGMEARKNPGDPYHIIASWNYLLDVIAGEYYELIWSTTDHTNVQMQYYAAGSPPPSAASVIMTVTQQSGIMAGTGISRGIYSVSSNTTAGSGANVDYVYFVTAAATITLPTAVGNTNTYTIKRTNAGTVTIATTSSQTIDGSTSINLNVQYVSITVVSDGTNWNII